MSPREPGASFASVVRVEKLTPTVKMLELEVEPKLTTFTPGQWVDFFIPGMSTVGGYSVCSVPSELPLIRLAIKDGRHPPTDWCFNKARVGENVQVRIGGSFGISFKNDAQGQKVPQQTVPCHTKDGQVEISSEFCLPSTIQRVVLVAGGIGITPLLPILKEFALQLRAEREVPRGVSDGLATTLPNSLHLIYGARSLEELAFEHEIRTLVETDPLVHTLSLPLFWSCARMHRHFLCFSTFSYVPFSFYSFCTFQNILFH